MISLTGDYFYKVLNDFDHTGSVFPMVQPWK